MVSDVVSVHRLKFFEQRDAARCDGEEEVAPLVRNDGTLAFEVDRFEGHRTYKGRSELLVLWKGYDTTWDSWVTRGCFTTGRAGSQVSDQILA